jgi:hypothetical protein
MTREPAVAAKITPRFAIKRLDFILWTEYQPVVDFIGSDSGDGFSFALARMENESGPNTGGKKWPKISTGSAC